MNVHVCRSKEHQAHHTAQHTTYLSHLQYSGRPGQKRVSIGARVRRASEKGGSMGGEVKTVLEVGTADSILVDAETGRRYSYNAETSETKWLDEGEEQGGATQSETKNHSTKRQSFRKIVGDDNAVFFQNIETEETVWEVPKNGDLVEL